MSESDLDEGLLTPGEWLIVEAFHDEYEVTVERVVRDGDPAWPAVDRALVQLNDVYLWQGTLMEERRERGEHPGLEQSAELEAALIEGRSD